MNRFGILLLCLLLIGGCIKEAQIPPEVHLAEQQEMDLWRAEAHLYIPQDYENYKEHLNKSKRNLLEVSHQFPWFRDYEPVRAEFLKLLKEGEELKQKLQNEKEKKRRVLLDQTDALQEKLNLLSKLTLIYHGKHTFRDHLAKAEVALSEAKILIKENQLIPAEKKLPTIEIHLNKVQEGIYPVLARYQHPELIAKWKRWAREAIEESREKDIYSILIIKSEKKLILYKKGEPVKIYPVSFGKNGWMDKLQSKDHATPEGKYHIIGKNPRSKYYKALLINYPNEEDRREFERLKKKGVLGKKATIGGLIEIHGGGKDNLTYGCIALDNGPMEELYHKVEVGTPVTIIGARDERNSLSLALIELQRGYEEKKNP